MHIYQTSLQRLLNRRQLSNIHSSYAIPFELTVGLYPDWFLGSAYKPRFVHRPLCAIWFAYIFTYMYCRSGCSHRLVYT